MREGRDLPLFRWGEELRRRRRAQRAGRLRIAAALCVSAACALGATLLWPPRPLLVWNASPSSPVGLYRINAPAGVRVGHMVVAWPPPSARHLAAARHYLPLNVPLVKRLAAAGGDRVCAAGEAIFVNGRFEALRRSEDSMRRPLPWWTGCRVLREGELFLLVSGAADSFDGRYFGVTERRHLIGGAKLIWAH